MVPTTSSSTLKNTTPKYFEEYGLRIPLIKRGQRIPHARLASELATCSKEKLSAIVQDFLQAASKATKLIKTLHSKSATAEWIESAETLALGPHPESELPSTKKEDLIKALGLKTTAPKVKAPRAKKDVSPKKKPGQKQAASPTKDKAVAQSTVSSLPSTEREPAAAQNKTSPSSPSSPPQLSGLATDLIFRALRTDIEPASITNNTNKRKNDSATETAHLEQTTSKKTKTCQAVSPPEDALLLTNDTVVSQAPASAQHISASIPSSEQASHDQGISLDSTRSTQQAHEHTNRDTSSLEIDLSSKNKDTSMVVHLSTKDIVATRAPLDTYIPEVDWKRRRTGRFETLDGGRTYNKKQNEVIYFTFIPHDYDGDACRQREVDEMPFLKPGRHGRHGDFADDPDLHTGQGHQVEPADLKRRRDYEARYREFHRTWPNYPYVDERRSLLTKQVDGIQLFKEEMWMMEYRNKYQGESVDHLWPCGCEKPLNGDESEEE